MSALACAKGGGASGEMSHSGEFETGGSMESLVEMVQIENSVRNY